MAKWGEGDRRWIAEERADATNVNNWHWCQSDSFFLQEILWSPLEGSTSLFSSFQKVSSGGCDPPPSSGVKIPTCKLNLKETFLTSPEELYRVFVNQEMVQAFTHAAPTVDPEKGGRFHLLDGNII